jgi:hypothetical protein
VTRGHRWRRHGPIAGPLARRVSARTTALSAKIRLVGTQGSLGARLLPPGELSRGLVQNGCVLSARTIWRGDGVADADPLVRLRRPKAKLFPTSLDQRQQGPQGYSCSQHPTRPATPCVRCGRSRSMAMASDRRCSAWSILLAELDEAEQPCTAATMACAPKPPRAVPQCVLRPIQAQAGAGGSVGVKVYQDGAPLWGGKPHSGQGSRRGRRGALGSQGYGQKAANIEH